MKKSKILPPRVFFCYLLVVIGVYYILPVMQVITGLYRLIGVPFLIFGLGLNLWADRLFKRQNTTVKPFEKSSTFIVEGPFTFTRNPMYVGMTAALLGLAILLGSVVVFALPFLFMIHVHYMYIIQEESALCETFGESYDHYRRQVRRWL
ncbi:MAG: isoprenylcysteine carboxylmethyltransferase family protein [candidate division Zixibacteria bacterium]|nr:isoprenylcysteine carboxylmethyltransferase family protein [candidate division Zixibacteria bacterium]